MSPGQKAAKRVDKSPVTAFIVVLVVGELT
jgi:hypothetical protein